MRWAALGLWVVLAGCRGLPWRAEAFERAVRVEALALHFEPEGRGLLTLRLEVRNPSAEPARLTAADFSLAVEGRPLATGQQQVERVLGGDGLPHVVELAFPLVAEGSVAGPSRRARPVYVSGGLLLRYGAGPVRRAPFHAQRVLELSWVPAAEPLLD